VSIILVRHTRPNIANGICYGRTDLDVVPSFEEESSTVIAGLGPADVVVSSPLQRCLKLADRIAEAMRLEVQVDSRVQEMDFGRWEGLPWSDIARVELDAWAADFLHARSHAGESVAMLRERTLAALDDYRRSDNRYIVVTHSGVIKAALATGDSAQDFQTTTDFGGIVQLD